MKAERSRFDLIMTLVFLALAILAILVRIRVQMWLPIWGNGDANFDDALLARYADTLRKGEWLGAFSNATLCKVSGFSAFLAVLNRLGIPYQTGLILFYGMACFLFMVALKKLFRTWILPFLSFLFLLYSPVLLEVMVGPRFYCMALVPPFLVLFLAAFVGIYTCRKEEDKRVLVCWLLLAGLSYGGYRLIRVDHAYLTLFFAVALLVLLISWLRDPSLRKRSLLLLLPVATALVLPVSAATVNRVHYGLFLTNDFTEGAFPEFCSALMEIRPEREDQGIYVSTETMQRAAKVSPAFAELYPLIEKDAEAGVLGALDGEWGAEFYAWELRNAMQQAGLYSDGQQAQSFMQKATAEIRQAFDDGTLEKREGLRISPFVGPLQMNEIPGYLARSIKAVFTAVASYEDLYASFATYSGPEDGYILMSELAKQHLYPEDTAYALEFSGSLKDAEEAQELMLYDEAGRSVSVKTDETGAFSFRLHGYEIDTAHPRLLIRAGETVVFDGLLEEAASVNVQTLFYGEAKVPETELQMMESAEKHIGWVERLIDGYQVTGRILAVLAILFFFIGITGLFFRSGDPMLYVLKIGVFLMLLVLVFTVSVHDAPYSAAFGPVYGIGAFTLWQLFVVLSVAGFARFCTDLKRFSLDKKGENKYK